MGLFGADRAVHALLRGADLALATGAELRVVRVLPSHRTMSRMLFPHHHDDELAATMLAEVEAMIEDEAWCDEVLGEHLGARHVVRHGELAECVAEEAASVATRVIVIPSGVVDVHVAIELAQRVLAPVLLARPRTAADVIVAATDLEDRSLPVLRVAAGLAPTVTDRIVCIHNVPPAIDVDPMGALYFPALSFLGRTAARREWLLGDAVRQISPHGDPLITNRSRTADAILDAARDHDADVIALGARAHGTMARWFHPGVAEQVCRRTRRSVLLAPLTLAA